MVHALKEIWRVLVPGGYLIDLRPFNETSSVEIVCDDAVIPAGIIDEAAGFPDDLAANRAIKTLADDGLFTIEQNDAFDLLTYWNTYADFKTYMDGRSKAILPSETQAQVIHLFEKHGENTRVRTRIRMIIARYRKTELA